MDFFFFFFNVLRVLMLIDESWTTLPVLSCRPRFFTPTTKTCSVRGATTAVVLTISLVLNAKENM